jgi:hypothetical protein
VYNPRAPRRRNPRVVVGYGAACANLVTLSMLAVEPIDQLTDHDIESRIFMVFSVSSPRKEAERAYTTGRSPQVPPEKPTPFGTRLSSIRCHKHPPATGQKRRDSGLRAREYEDRSHREPVQKRPICLLGPERAKFLLTFRNVVY